MPSYDGGQLNSGFLGFTNGCGIISTNAHRRYEDLVSVYGKLFNPPIEDGAGVIQTNGVFWIDNQHLVYFETMNRWRKEGK